MPAEVNRNITRLYVLQNLYAKILYCVYVQILYYVYVQIS